VAPPADFQDTSHIVEGPSVDAGPLPASAGEFLLEQAPPADRSPIEAYLRRVSPGSRAALRELLDQLAAHLTVGRGTADTCAWHLVRAHHAGEIHAALRARYPLAAVGKMLAVLRGVLKECWRLGLLTAEDYRSASESIALRRGQVVLRRAPSRDRLLSVLETAGGEQSAPRRHNGTVRVLLQANGFKPDPAAGTVPSEALAQARRGRPIGEGVYRHRVSTAEAIAHLLWEADVCLRQRAFCACLAMLRAAVDLWSRDYRDRFGLTLDVAAGERDTLYWRLVRIAEENKLLRTAIAAIIRGLGEAGDGDGPDGRVCHPGRTLGPDGLAAARLKASYRELQELVLGLVATGAPDLPL